MTSASAGAPPSTGRVRTARTPDLDRVAALWTAITEHHAPLDPLFRSRADDGGALRELLLRLHRDPDAEILVFDRGGDLPGMCIVRVDRAPPILEEDERAEITDLGVRPDARRQGIASTLVAAAFEWVRASAVGRVEVQVAVGNLEGQAFWRAHGFRDLMQVLHRRL